MRIFCILLSFFLFAFTPLSSMEDFLAYPDLTKLSFLLNDSDLLYQIEQINDCDPSTGTLLLNQLNRLLGRDFAPIRFSSPIDFNSSDVNIRFGFQGFGSTIFGALPTSPAR